MKYLWKLRAYLKPYWKQILIALIGLLTITGMSLIVPVIIQRVIDQGLVQGQTGMLAASALILLGIGILRSALAYGQRNVTEWIAQHVGYDLRNDLYDHIQHLPFSFHDHSQTGQLISRCIEDVRAIQNFTGTGVIELVRMSLLMVGILVLLFIENAQLAVIAMLPLIPLFLITTHFGRRVGELFMAVDNALGELSSRLQENVVGVQVVRAFAREGYEIKRFREANKNLYDARVEVNSQWSRVMPSTNFLVALGTILILYFGGRMVLAGEMSLGEVVAFNSYLVMLSAPAQQLTWVVNAAGEAVAGVQRTFEVLELEPEIQSPHGAYLLPPLEGRVEFDHVSFNYEQANRSALIDINQIVEPNQLVALIGPTGSGKTSLINLVPRFYDATSGCVKVDGHDVRSVDLVSLRKQIGIVLQTSLLFSATIRENIAYGRPDAPDDEVYSAARAAQAQEFIEELPEGYDTVVGERGVTLSGGQRQRIAIARALLMDPRILILDDSTSSVDTQTEHQIQKALNRLMEGRTTFVIAHRLSTVKRANLILVMDAGRIVERGTHSDLLAQNGLYREIYELQLRDQEHFREEMEMLEANGMELSRSGMGKKQRVTGSRTMD